MTYSTCFVNDLIWLYICLMSQDIKNASLTMSQTTLIGCFAPFARRVILKPFLTGMSTCFRSPSNRNGAPRHLKALISPWTFSMVKNGLVVFFVWYNLTHFHLIDFSEQLQQSRVMYHTSVKGCRKNASGEIIAMKVRSTIQNYFESVYFGENLS